MYLSEVADAFVNDLQNTYGTSSGVDYQSKIETIDTQYAFIKFGKLTALALTHFCKEKQIIRKRKDFRDVNAKENIDKLNQELMDVSKIMSESFDMLLNRDRNLNDLSDKAHDLRDGSSKFKNKSQKLKLSMYFRQYMAPIVICLVLFAFVLAKMYLF